MLCWIANSAIRERIEDHAREQRSGRPGIDRLRNDEISDEADEIEERNEREPVSDHAV